MRWHLVGFSLDPLAKNFVLGKPIKQGDYDEKIIYELEKRGHLIITIKVTGKKLFVVKTNGKFKIYTDSTNDVTDKFPHCAKELEMLAIPNHSLLACEGILDKKGEERAKLMFFDVVVWGCVDLSRMGLDTPYSTVRLWRIQNVLRSGAFIPQYLLAVQVLRMSYDRAKKEAVRRGWEGLVLYHAAFKSSFRLDGRNPERTEGCYTWKP